MTGAWTNWAGNVVFGARRVHRPSTVDELREVVHRGRPVRALGTGHSFSRVADAPGDLVSLAGLPPTVEVDAERATATVAAGVRYGELAPRLHAAGWALPNLASLPHISVAGACATGTHGSGDGNGGLATAVSAFEIVTAGGGLVRLDRDAGDFPGAMVALGALGIVTRLTLDLVPAYDLRQDVYEGLPLDRLDDHLDEVFASGYSVSLFTTWRTGAVDLVWLKRRAGTGRPPSPWLGAVLADGPRHPLRGAPVERCTPQLGVPGPWHERLPHFRAEYTPSSGEELQSEHLVPRSCALDALHAVERIRHRVAPVLQVSEIRTVAADDLWLSPSHGRDSLAIHFTWTPDAAAVLPVVRAVDEALAPYGARPHWGKVLATPPEAMAERYERLPEFRRLLDRWDPAGQFGNAFLDTYVRGGG